MIGGQATQLSRGAHDIRHDEVHDEIWITNPHASAILAFRGGADGAEAPVRIIQGPKTQIVGYMDRLDVDPVHNEVFLPNGDQVLVFDRKAQGDVSPIRVLRGPDTQLNRSQALAVDPVHNLIVVGAGAGREEGNRVKLLFFDRTDNGNVKPKGEILLPETDPEPRPRGQFLGQLQVYPPKGWIVASVPGLYQSWLSDDYTPYIGIWSIHDRGEVPPRWKLGGDKSNLMRPRGVALIPKHKELVVADMHANSVLIFYFPELF